MAFLHGGCSLGKFAFLAEPALGAQESAGGAPSVPGEGQDRKGRTGVWGEAPERGPVPWLLRARHPHVLPASPTSLRLTPSKALPAGGEFSSRVAKAAPARMPLRDTPQPGPAAQPLPTHLGPRRAWSLC